MKILCLMTLVMMFSVQAKTFNKKIFEQTISNIKKEAFYKLSDDEVYKAAIAGVLKYLESKNKKLEKKSGFVEDANILLPPRNVSELSKEMKGEVSGIGVGIKYDKDKGFAYPVLIDIVKDGGASRAGLLKGDQILKIDGAPVSEFKSFKDIVYKIRGKAGTNVNLAILRDGETFKKRVKRKKLVWDAVEVTESNKKYSLIKVNFFNEKTVATLEKEFLRMKKRGTRSLILDLRGNNGGLFKEGLKAINLFAQKGDTVLLAKYGTGEVKRLKASKDGIGKSLKAVILISEDTKSMGEAFTASLKKLRNAVVIGEKSYGKGTMETVMNLDNSYSVKFTVGRLFSPDDKTWDRVGIQPDVKVPYDKEKAKDGESDHQVELAKLLVIK